MQPALPRTCTCGRWQPLSPLLAQQIRSDHQGASLFGPQTVQRQLVGKAGGRWSQPLCLSGCPARPSDSQGQSFCLQGPRRPTRRPPVGGSRKRGRPGLLLKVPSPEPPSHPLNTSWWLDTGRYLSVADCRRRLLGEGRGLEQVRLALGFWRRCTQEAGTCGPVGTAGSFLLSLPCFSPVDTKEETSWWLLPLDFQVSATS